MAKLKQTFRNPTNTRLFVNLELSTSRFRLRPGETLILSYDSADRPACEHGAALGIEVIQGADGQELLVWTMAQEMFYPDGRAAPLDFGRA